MHESLKKAGVLALFLLLANKAPAAVNDILPADYFPLVNGMSSLGIYAYDRQASGPYVRNRKIVDGELSTQILALRGVHFFEVAERPFSVVAVVPWSATELAPSALASVLGKQASGLGDLRLGATGWLLAEREKGRYLGISALASLPTGDYDNRQSLNIGENRYKATLNIGWIEPLGQNVLFELSPELAWFGDNPDYVGGKQLEQRTAYALTSYLRYRATPNWQFHAGAQINRGGETIINSIRQDNAADNSRLMLGFTFLSDSKQHQWIVRVARDTEIRNGFKLDSEVLVRYLWMF